MATQAKSKYPNRADQAPIDVSSLSDRENMILEFALSGLRSAIGEDDRQVNEAWRSMMGDTLKPEDVDALAARFGFVG